AFRASRFGGTNTFGRAGAGAACVVGTRRFAAKGALFGSLPESIFHAMSGTSAIATTAATAAGGRDPPRPPHRPDKRGGSWGGAKRALYSSMNRSASSPR